MNGNPSDPLLDPLTPRELDVLRLLAEGLSNQEIAERLFFTVDTVRWYTKQVYSKLGVHERTRAVRRAQELGLLEASPTGPTSTGVLSPKHNLPTQSLPFIGREEDIERLVKLLAADASCRLLTLVGLGGIGKTRLAVEVGGRLLSYFRDGIYFIPLQPVASVNVLEHVIADVLNLTFSGPVPPRDQLLTFLRSKHLLLIMDTFEHLLDGVDLINEIVRTAPKVKLFVTAREPLKLQTEWLYPLSGMPVPEEAPVSRIDSYSTVRLFEDRAKRVRRNFSLADEQAGVVRVVRLLEGVPLAIELAAGWTTTLPCSEIADEIKRDLDFLASALRDMPERHRSMRLVLEYSYQLLTLDEQAVLNQLSVFDGGFDRPAAEQVAQATLKTLATLVEKSLLWRWEDGRYSLHELVRQFAEAKLKHEPALHLAAQEKHGQYFAQLLWDYREPILDQRHHETIPILKGDVANLRQAWRWLVAHENWQALEQSWETAYLFFFYVNRYQEGKTLFSLAVDRLHPPFENEERQRARASALLCSAWFSFMLGQVSGAKAQVDEALALIEDNQLSDTRLLLHVLHCQALTSWALRDLEGALQLSRRLLGVAYQTDKDFYRAMGHFDFGLASFIRGELEIARDHLRQAAELTAVWSKAYAYFELGRVVDALGDDDDARQMFAQSLSAFERFEDHWGVANSLVNLGRVTGRMGYLAEATTYLYEALDLILAFNTPQVTIGALAEIAFLLPAIRQLRLAVSILEFLQTQTGVWQEYHGRVEQCLSELQQAVEAEKGSSDDNLPQFHSLEELIEVVQAVRSQFQIA